MPLLSRSIAVSWSNLTFLYVLYNSRKVEGMNGNEELDSARHMGKMTVKTIRLLGKTSEKKI